MTTFQSRVFIIKRVIKFTTLYETHLKLVKIHFFLLPKTNSNHKTDYEFLYPSSKTFLKKENTFSTNPPPIGLQDLGIFLKHGILD